MPYRTTPKMAARKAANRARLLRTSVRLFARDGYHATTVPMIVRAAGSSTGNFYFYFRNKEDIFATALEEFGAEIARALNSAIARATGTRDQMKAAIEEFVRVLAAHPEQARVLIVESSGLSSRLDQIRRSIIQSHARSVERALQHLGRGRDSAVLARCWVGAVLEAVVYWLQLPASRRQTSAQLARVIASFNLRGVSAK